MATEYGRAFGVPFASSFPFPGLPPSELRPGEVAVQLDLVPRRSIERPPDAETISRSRRFDGRTIMRFTRHPQAGHLLEAVGYGRFEIDADVTRVRCGPVRCADPFWQRFLVGQVLPFVSVLRGYEVFHASMVALKSRGVVVIAASGAGKSTLAAALVGQGASYVTDDVLAVDPETLLGHAGFGATNVRHDAAGRLGADAVAALGPPVLTDDEAVRVAVEVVGEPVPVDAVFFLSRAEPGSAEPLITRLDEVAPPLLLGASYNFVIRTPERLTRQLDVCARLSRAAAFHRIVLPPDVGPFELADEVAARVEALA